MQEEINSIEENKTWKLVDQPPRYRPIGLKWVFKLKKDAAGRVVKHKARLVAKGYVQKEGVDFDEVFAPVAQLDLVRLLLALAAQEGWIVHHMDVKSAFLNGELEEDVYVYVVEPPGFVVVGQENKAPRAWNIKLDNTLKNLGFVQSPLEHGLYARGSGDARTLVGSGDARTLVGVYVDDLIIVGSSCQKVEEFKRQMKKEFKMSDLGPLSFYLGIEVQQVEGVITLSQGAYAERIVEKAGLTGCNPCAIPMDPKTKLSDNSEEPPVDGTEYRSSRPDLAYAVGYVSRFMQKPTEEHRAAVKTIIRYVAGTTHYGCRYAKDNSWRLQGYSDSDWAGDVDRRKSTSGVLYTLGSNVISWQSQKQRVVALSSCEAEYVAATSGACQGIWLARLLGDLRGTAPVGVDFMADNKSAVALMKNPVHHERSKHIQIKYHFIREAVETGDIRPVIIGTAGQLADLLTKALSKTRFQGLRDSAMHEHCLLAVHGE
ncbi:hypothetical protein U9M48_042040 [Paspalum notatum var. saurae]|uniref:Reverse transcriptase Ty1/copia-type domain-containing protein n=1 Tax=Paspalum notatum var. saurae TaxID=547442 RepID=A0AAQ3XFI6_PASNO